MSFKMEQHIAVETNDAKKPAESTDNKRFWEKELSFGGGGFGDKKKERFYDDMRVLLVAGVDLKTALEIIIQEQAKEKDKVLFEEIYQGILKGKSLASCLKETGKFSEYEYFSIEIGEEANRLNEVLDELTTYYADQTALKRQVVSVLTYPLFVFGVTLGLVYFMMTTIVPMFADIFKQFGSELPPLTQKNRLHLQQFSFSTLWCFWQ